MVCCAFIEAARSSLAQQRATQSANQCDGSSDVVADLVWRSSLHVDFVRHHSHLYQMLGRIHRSSVGDRVHAACHQSSNVICGRQLKISVVI
jgi:hypothetical protein